MWEMAKNSIILFLQGRLFQDTSKVFRQIFIGALLTAIAFVAVAACLPSLGVQLGDGNIWLAAGIAGFLGGLIQPYLFKDLKYA